MASADIAALDALALPRRDQILQRLIDTDRRLSLDLMSLNASCAARSGVRAMVEPDGCWHLVADGECRSGRGMTRLIGKLADVDDAAAARFLSKLVESAEGDA